MLLFASIQSFSQTWEWTKVEPNGTTEFFLCKLNSNGNVVWNKTSKFCGIFAGEGVTLTADKKGNLIVSGVKLQVNNPPINFFNFGSDVITDNTGHNPFEKLFILNYSNAGTLDWSNFATDCGDSGSVQSADYTGTVKLLKE